MLKFYIAKRDERGTGIYKQIMEFESHLDLEAYLSYNRAYIEEMRTLDNDITYDIEGAE